jgi:hypothetical protein
VAWAPTCRNVIVTENKVNFLTLPESPGTLAIFGGGYALGLLTKLLDHRDIWSEEPLNGRCSQELPALNDDEVALYDDLRHNRLGIRVRLEQERVNFEHVKVVVESL